MVRLQRIGGWLLIVSVVQRRLLPRGLWSRNFVACRVFYADMRVWHSGRSHLCPGTANSLGVIRAVARNGHLAAAA